MHNMHSFLVNFIHVLLLFDALLLSEACIDMGSHNFGITDRVIWESHNGTVNYTISVCQTISQVTGSSPCGEQAAICQINADGQATNIGTFSSTPNVTESDGIIQLRLQGEACKEISGQYYVTVLNFKCGKTLGSPIFLDSYACGTNFDWYTTAACKTAPMANEVKCYVYNNQHQKIDLSPLIKTRGAHQVNNFGEEFYVNVCRDITTSTNSSTSSCDARSAACFPSGQPYKNVGYVKDALHMDDSGRPTIKYIQEVKGDDIPAECTQAPSTTIKFMCPARGQSGSPTLLSGIDCQYEVLWETEYACPDIFVSDNCVLTRDIHGIDVDLSPLKGQHYSATGYNLDHTKEYTYYMSICEELAMGCPDAQHKDNSSVCQTSKDDTDFGKSLGKVDQEQLRFTDGDLILTYKGGAKCHTNFHRVTVINFHCSNSLPTTSLGSPVFTAEDDCTYMFDWDTPLACVDTAVDKTCQVKGQGHLYDLSDLVITKGMNEEYWEVEKTNDDDDSFIILNVCAELVHEGLAQLCDKGAAACVMDEPGHWMSLGNPSQPTYDIATGQVQLRYTDGSSCNNGNSKARSVINFLCEPGQLNSPPLLTRKSSDGCEYEFEWVTAAVCALKQVVGTDCQVMDDQLGVTFDLRPLTNTDQGYYVVHHPETQHDYYINVCAPVTGTPCNTGDKTQMGACQIDTTNSQVFSIGHISSQLRYGDDFLNLTYTMGDYYNSSPKRARTTEIAFICDPKAGIGSPVFVEGSQYAFTWLTSYACADVPVECTVISEETPEEYDLTRLVRKPSESNWVTVDDEQSDNKKRTFYMNICHHLVAGEEGCDMKSSICEKTLDPSSAKDVVSHASLGRSRSRPIIDASGELTLLFTDGMQCETNTSATYTTKVHMHCRHGAIETSPRLVGIDHAVCEYVFHWDHAAACPIEHTETHPGDICTLTDTSVGFTYNLKPLMKSDYTVQHGDDVYKLHICGAVSGQCQRIGEKAPSVCIGDQTLGEVSTILKFAQSGVLTLTYNGKRDDATGDINKVVIEFRCDQAVGEGEPIFIEKDGLVRLFRFFTSYACPPSTTECKAADDFGNIYDLSYLRKSTGNWEVVDTRPNHNDLRYYINVCGPVNAMAGNTHFCTGLAGACQTNSNNQSYNLGYLQGAPQAPGRGMVVLHYTGGDKCHKDTAGENYRSTIITLNCAETEHDPVFVNETSNCLYHFSWLTPLACSVAKATGSSCKVMETNFFMTFDLSGLKVADSYKVSVGEYEYQLNVCGDVSSSAEECLGAGSCQTKPSTGLVINAGKANDQLIYEDGELRLVYTEGKADCHGHFERKTIITFTCDREAGNGKPVYLNESSTCQYLFDWPTVEACATAVQEYTECSVQDSDGKQYDLSALRAKHNNYVFLDPVKKVKYVINICGAVLHGEAAACSPESAVCMVHLNTTRDKYENLGDFTNSEMSVTSDIISLKYKGGRKCSNGESATTIIKLICDKTEIASEPYLLDDSDGCNYVFQWMTSRACPVNTEVTPSGDCTATNPQTGSSLSLAQLMGNKWTVEDKSSHSYDISICGALTDSQCGDNVGVCQYSTDHPETSWIIGRPSSSPIYQDGTVRLTYTGGQLCHQTFDRVTIIDFVCGTTELGINKPVFIQEDANCTYFLSWHTTLACDADPMTCTAMSDIVTFDLSPLVLANGYHSAITAPDITEDASYYLNLCRPLNPITGAKCPPKSSICRVTSSGNILNLGEAITAPAIDPKSNKVTVVMEKGDVCAKDTARRWSSRIIFDCQPGLSAGTPSLVAIDYDTCVAVFSWPTYLVCTTAPLPDIDNDCTFTDTRRDYSYNFENMKRKSGEIGYTVTSPKSSGTYYVNICGSASAPGVSCGGAGVCLVADNKATSFGRAEKMSFVSSEFDVKLIYAAGDDCQGRPRKAYIMLECDYSLTGHIELSYERDCYVTFLYKTSLACPPVSMPCIFSHKGTTYDLSPLSRLTGSWSGKDPDQNQYWFNLCQGVHAGPVECASDAAVCWQQDGDSSVTNLARVLSQTVSMDEESESIIFEYSNGDYKCADSSNQGPAVFRVRLTCGNGIGRPVMKASSSNGCVFEAEWETTYACVEKRVRVFANKGYITDPETQLQISVLELSGGRTYEVEYSPFTYILNLDGLPAVDSVECSNMVVCQTRPSETTYHSSLGEKDTQTFFIKGELLEAHYTSPTDCNKNSPNQKASSVISFHCNRDNQTTGPVYVYKSKKCQYIFDWYTPAVCSLAQAAHPNTAGNGASGNSQVLSPAALGAVLGVSITLLIAVLLAALLIKPERRARVTLALRRVFRKPSYFTTYTYSSLNQAEEDSSLLRNSQGQYGADTGRLGNIQAFHDDSDEDILQL